MGTHKQTKDKRKEKRKYVRRRISLVILAVLVIIGIWFTKRLYDLDGNWLAALMGHNKSTLENLDKITVLVLGESEGNTDTILVFTYDPKTQNAGILSIPRDTFTGDNPSEARAIHKINSLYLSSGNPEDTLEAVNNITGLNIEHYVVVDTKALIELVDVIGGIEFDVPIDMKYDDKGQNLHINLKAGQQKLSGQQVEWLVRFRHNNNGSTYSYDYGIEDYGRMKTQRNVIKAIATQTIKLKNVKEIGHIIDVLNKYVKTDINVNSIKDYIPYAVKINVDEIKTEQLPGESKLLNQIWFFLHDKEETAIVVDRIFNNIQKESIIEDGNTVSNSIVE